MWQHSPPPPQPPQCTYDALQSSPMLTSYDDRALVLYDALAAALAVAAQGDPILRVGGQVLGPLCHNNLQQTVLAMPGRDVRFVRGSITQQQVRTHRPSYVNAILIQSRGSLVPGGCSRCRRSPQLRRPFPECRRVVGHFGGCCGNCKWRDHAARCVVREAEVVDLVSSDDDDSPDDDDRGIAYDDRNQRLLEGAANNPIQIN